MPFGNTGRPPAPMTKIFSFPHDDDDDADDDKKCATH